MWERDEGGRYHSVTDYEISIKRLKIEDWRIMISILKGCDTEGFRLEVGERDTERRNATHNRDLGSAFVKQDDVAELKKERERSNDHSEPSVYVLNVHTTDQDADIGGFFKNMRSEQSVLFTFM